jgi:putative transposase
MERVKDLGNRLGVAPTCDAFGIPRASYYRWWNRQQGKERTQRDRRSPRRLTERERSEVLAVLHDLSYVDLSPGQVVARLLDAGRYLCSERTMYRILSEADEVRERRNQLRHPSYQKPELLARRPNELWSWDITKLRGPVKWAYYYLYVILDVFSRYVVGWMVARREAAVLARRLIAETIERQGIERGELTIHSDRGPSMRSKPVALLLSDLGVVKSHSRPYCSSDNPYSESQFKTMKYRPEFPDRFGSLEDARAFGGVFFPWYNREHYHSGLGWMTPYDIHFGLAEAKRRHRERVLAAAYEKTPERFVRGIPSPAELPKEVWINKPTQIAENRLTDESGQIEIVRPERIEGVVLEGIAKIGGNLA